MERDKKFLVRKRRYKRVRERVDYRDERHDKHGRLEELPNKVGMKSRNRHNDLDTTPIARWLGTQVGKHIDQVYAAYIARIQPKYLEQHRKSLYWYLHPKHEVVVEGDKVYHLSKYGGKRLVEFETRAFYYVHPDTGIICKVPARKRPRHVW